MSVDYKRKMVPSEVTTLDVEYTAAEIIEECQRLIAEYGPEVYFERRTEDYSDHIYIGVFVKRLETDSQYSNRISQETETNEYQIKYDIREFERLKAKLGK